MRENIDPVRILIFDRHAIVRRGLRLILDQQLDFQVVGEAGNECAALQLALDLQPDLILFDLHLPGAKTFFRQLQEMGPRAKLLLLAAEINSAVAADAKQIGLRGYLLKTVDPAELADAIRIVHGGGIYFDPAVSVRWNQTGSAHLAAWTRPELTKRELDVLLLMPTLATNGEIAAALALGEETVRSHVKNILRKFKSRNRTQAVVEALRTEIITFAEIEKQRENLRAVSSSR